MANPEFDFLIVGTGAGGATLARELSKKGKKVQLIEKGKYENRLGTFKDSLRFYDSNQLTKMPRKSKEGVILWRTIMAGGSTMVSCGNATRCLEKELDDLGLNLNEEFQEAEREMEITYFPEELLSEGSKKILWASKELGYQMRLTPKFINIESCTSCGQCAFGCIKNAKWTALYYLNQAIKDGANIVYNVSVEKVIQENGKAIGIRGIGQNGTVDYFADKVILSAGGLGTPVILQKSGILNAGSNFFSDLLINTYGITNNHNQINEPVMALIDEEFYQSKGFILSTYVNTHKMVRFIEIGPRGLTLPVNRLIGIMTKIIDESAGYINSNGVISKPVTNRDWQRLREGSAIAKEILIKAGADSHSILFSKVQGAHPGGTASIGMIVDRNLQTEIKNLYVCDASILPKSPGMPPILTICALAKKLAKKLLIS